MKSTAPATVSIVSFAYTGCNEGEKIPPVQEGEILEDRTKTVFLFSGFVFHKYPDKSPLLGSFLIAKTQHTQGIVVR